MYKKNNLIVEQLLMKQLFGYNQNALDFEEFKFATPSCKPSFDVGISSWTLDPRTSPPDPWFLIFAKIRRRIIMIKINKTPVIINGGDHFAIIILYMYKTNNMRIKIILDKTHNQHKVLKFFQTYYI